MLLINWDETGMVMNEDDWLEVKWLAYAIYDIAPLKSHKEMNCPDVSLKAPRLL